MNKIEVRGPIAILDERLTYEVWKNESPEAKAAQMEHAIKREISVKMAEDEVFYQKLSERLQEILERFKAEQITIFELLDEMEEQRQALIEKAEGKTKSGLSAEQEPYYNRLVESFPELADEQLRIVAVDTQAFIENKVSSILDWKAKRDFKKNLEGELLRFLIGHDLTVQQATILTGYFMAIAEQQY